MHRHSVCISLGLTSGTLGFSLPAMAKFIDDGKASVELRNFYFNRDFRQDNAPQSKAEEWT